MNPDKDISVWWLLPALFAFFWMLGMFSKPSLDTIGSSSGTTANTIRREVTYLCDTIEQAYALKRGLEDGTIEKKAKPLLGTGCMVAIGHKRTLTQYPSKDVYKTTLLNGNRTQYTLAAWLR